MAKKTIYYSDLQNDDFANTALDKTPIPSDFRFAVTDPFWRILEFILYRLIATPVVWLIGKIGFGLRIKNRRALRKLRRTGYYLYGNHTQGLMDAYAPTLVAFPKHAHVIVGSAAMSSPALRLPIKLLGGIPIPDNFKGLQNFMKALSLRISEKRVVTVYPEAHIWPWYTGIRPFPDTSFAYPVRDGVPAVAFVTIYRKRKIFSKLPPCLTVTVSEPFYPDETLPAKQRSRDLRDRVYETMCERAKHSDVEVIRYVKKED